MFFALTSAFIYLFCTHECILFFFGVLDGRPCSPYAYLPESLQCKTKCKDEIQENMCRLATAHLDIARRQVARCMLIADNIVGIVGMMSARFPKAFLMPGMANRVAEMLGYLLRHLVGPDRSKLRVSDPDAVCPQSVTVIANTV
jgi:hypothetical protein